MASDVINSLIPRRATAVLVGALLALTSANAADNTPPRLFLSSADIPALQQHAEGERAGALLSILREMASRYRSIPTNPFDSDGAYVGRNLQNYITTLALIGFIDGDTAALNKAKEIMLAAVDQFDVDYYRRANIHLAVGDAAIALAIGYQWLEDFLNEEETVRVRDHLHSLGGFLRHARPNPRQPNRLFFAHHNHSTIVHTGLLLTGILLEEHEWVDYATPWIGKFIEQTTDGSGAPYEGLGYYEYGMSLAAIANEALRSVGGPDYMAKNRESMMLVSRYLLHHLKPWEGAFVPIGQTSDSMASASSIYYTANLEADATGLAAWESLLGIERLRQMSESAHPSHLRMIPLMFLWTDNNLQAAFEIDEPLSREWRRGKAAARTGWNDPDAALFTFQSTDTHLGGWDHPDENTFTFSAWGDALILDPGAHIYSPASHGIILIDGIGYAGFLGPGHRTLGIWEHFEERGCSVYAVADARKAYTLDAMEQLRPDALPVKRAERRTLFVRASLPFVVVADRITMSSGARHDFTMRTVYRSPSVANSAEIVGNGRALIRGARAGAEAVLHVLYPTDAELSLSVNEEPRNRHSGNIDALSGSATEGRFLSVVTAAPYGTEHAKVSKEGNNLVRIQLSADEVWEVTVEDNDIKARRQN